MSDPTCAVVFADGTPCPRRRKYAKLCDTCYAWSRSNGDADPNGRPRRRRNGELLAEIRAAAAATTDECVILTGFADRPHVPLDGVMMHASRAVWTVRHGDPGDAHVLHTCHRGEDGCINVRHLYLGDNDRNVRDMVEARRHGWGERNPGAVLDEAQVEAIRKAYVPRVVPQRVLAEQYGVSQQTISDVVRGKLWGHVGHIVTRGRLKSGE